MTPGPDDPDRVDPTNQSGRSIIGPLALLLIFTALATMVVIFIVST